MYPKAEVFLVFLYGTIAEILDVGGESFDIGFLFLAKFSQVVYFLQYTSFLTARVTISVFQQLEEITSSPSFNSKLLCLLSALFY